MKIAIVSPEFPPEKGGVQTYASEYARELARRGNDVTVFTSPHISGEMREAEFPIKPVLALRRRLDKRVLEDKSFDVWHAMNASYSWLALEAPNVFVTIHGNDFLKPYHPVARLDLRERLRLPFGSNADRWLGDYLTQKLVKHSLPHAAHIFTNSRYTLDAFLSRYPGCHDKASAAMVGVSEGLLSKIRPVRSGGAVRLLTVCRLAERHKNVDKILEALAVLRPEFDFHYTIAGDGWLRPSLEKLTDECGLRDRVTFTGFIDDSHLHSLLLSSDLFILTTSLTPVAYEGFGLVYLEAAASGLPVLAARIGGAVEAVNEGVSGFFVEAATVEEITNRLREFLSGAVHFSPDACKSVAGTFSWGKVVEHCMEQYQAA